MICLAHLDSSIAVRSQEILALGGNVIPFPLEQMDHAIASIYIVGRKLRIGQGQKGNTDETFGQKHVVVDETTVSH